MNNEIMNNDMAITAIVLLALILIGVGTTAWFAFQLLQASRQNALQSSQDRQKLIEVFLKADGSFKAMIDSLRDIENLDEVKKRVAVITANLIDMNSKIGSQLETSGRIIAELHRLIGSWSEEGTQLQRSYQELAKTMERVLTLDLKQREELDTKLEALIQAQTGTRR